MTQHDFGAGLGMGPRATPCKFPNSERTRCGTLSAMFQPTFIIQTVIGFAVLGVWALVLRLRRGPASGPAFNWARRPVAQACSQASIYVYWSLYVPEAAARWPLVLIQLVFALVADRLANWQTRDRAMATTSILPIVFSLNFFGWFPPNQFGLQLTFLLLAILSKGLFRWKNREHVFNPSAIALTVMGLYCLVSGHEFLRVDRYLALPPNISEVIFISGLLVQVGFGVGTHTLFGFWALMLFGPAMRSVFGLDGAPVPFPAQQLLGLTLLMTDPVTSPRSSAGRALFGAMYGVLYVLFSVLPHAGHEQEYFAKIYAAAAANLMTPALDQVGERIGTAAARLATMASLPIPSSRVVGFAAVIAYLVSFATLYTPDQKCRLFVDSHDRDFKLSHPTALLDVSGGTLSCERNPIHSRPFSFREEAEVWLSG